MEKLQAESLAYHFIEVSNILTNYVSAFEGYPVANKAGDKTRASDSFCSPFEVGIIAKSDIDSAISKLNLKHPQAWLNFCQDIYSRPHDLTPQQTNLLKFILDPTTRTFPASTVWQLTDILNGNSTSV